MKRLSICVLSIIFLLCGCTSDSSDTSSDAFSLSPEVPVSTEKQTLPEISAESNSITSTQSSVESVTSEYYPDSSVGPDEIELMSYSQTVLRKYFPDCKYSRNTSDYTFAKTNLRYKIEGSVTIDSDHSEENFYMIINFVDESYTSYDLISLQIGNETIYDASSDYSYNSQEDNSSGSILNAENAKIYNEVMDALNADYDRDENSILEELAPNYGMTASDLKEFLRAYLEAYYAN